MNYESIGIENCHHDVEGKFDDATLNSLQNLLADICERYNLNPMNDIIRHYDVIGKRCPKYYVDNPAAFNQIKRNVENIINVGNTEVETRPEVGIEYIVTPTIGLNIRSAASETAAKIGAYEYNATVTIYEQQNGWGRTDRGWVPMQYLKNVSDTQVGNYRITPTIGVNIRSMPNETSTKVGAYEYNTIVTIYEQQNGWGRTDKGWISMLYVTKSDFLTGTDYKVTPIQGLNIRISPNVISKKIGAYSHNAVITVYEQQNGWGRTKDGWISMRYVSEI